MGGRHGEGRTVCVSLYLALDLLPLECMSRWIQLKSIHSSSSSPQAAAAAASRAIKVDDTMAAMEHLVQQVNQLILRPELHDILAILKGARNGFVYGVSESLLIPAARNCRDPRHIYINGKSTAYSLCYCYKEVRFPHALIMSLIFSRAPYVLI